MAAQWQGLANRIRSELTLVQVALGSVLQLRHQTQRITVKGQWSQTLNVTVSQPQFGKKIGQINTPVLLAGNDSAASRIKTAGIYQLS